MSDGVHRTHCCVIHGCKYGDHNCPVETGRVKQAYVCEDCESLGIKKISDINKYLKGQLKCCPNCGYINESGRVA